MHYSILAIGEDIEGQMAPYDESRDVDPYKERVTEEDIDRAVTFYKERNWKTWSTPPKGEQAIEYEIQHEKAEAAEFDPQTCYRLYQQEEADQVCEDDEGLFTWSTYNTEGKWDYWRIGGRYCRRLMLKPGAAGHREPLSWEWEKQYGNDPSEAPNGYDQAKAGDVDFEKMSLERVAKAEAAYFKFEEIVEALGPMPTRNPDARKAFFEHPVVKAMEEAELSGWNSAYSYEDFELSRSNFIEKERLHRILPFYGDVYEGKWFEQESWKRDLKKWVPGGDYYKRRSELVLSLPADTLLTCLDIHS